MTETPSVFGIIGLGVMGRNLALNIEEKGFPVAAWNREYEATERFLSGEGAGRKIQGFRTLKELAEALPRPRRILMMIKSGAPVDETVGKLMPLLQEGDVLLDGGNSHFPDTERRCEALRSDGVHFFGTGVSGGEMGARYGPSLMPGGDRQAYSQIAPVLEKIAAQVEDGPCVAYVGPGGAGHFVKTVHNGIEYAVMQLLAEAYDAAKRLLGMDSAETSDLFDSWNRGPLRSFLLDITSRIFTVKDEETGQPLVEVILDQAEQKGTGKWTAQAALDLGTPISSIYSAIEARFFSAQKENRERVSRRIPGPQPRLESDKAAISKQLHDAFFASFLVSYCQGLSLIQEASVDFQWRIDRSEVCRIWKGGCIIRADLLSTLQELYRAEPELWTPLESDPFQKWLAPRQDSWRHFVSAAVQSGLAIPCLTSSLTYYDSLRTADLPQNLTQAQRDFFGSHRYRRRDRPQTAPVHTDWYAETGYTEKG